MFPVYGELDGAGTSILVTSGGDSVDINRCVEILVSLTPHLVPTPDPHTMSMPLSWAAVTQLAHAFRGGEWGGQWMPGARLSNWLIEEIIRRSCEGDVTGQDPKLEPMAHQSAGALAIGMNGRFLLADDMGTGKGGTYFMGLAELETRGRQPWPALMVAPAGVVDTLMEEIPQWYPDWKAAAYRGSSRARYLKSDARILVMSYETMRNDTGLVSKPGPLLKFRAGTVIFDECVTYDTLLEVRGGVKHICYVQPGQQVRAVDHETGELVWTTVRRVGRSPLRETVRIGRTEMSLNHPVWVSDDGCIAYATGYDQDVRLLPVWGLIRPEVVPELAGAEVLRPDMRTGVAGRGPGAEGGRAPGEQGSAGVPEDAGVPGVRPESVPWFNRRAHSPARSRDERRQRVAGSFGRQWQGAYYPAGIVAEATRRGVHPRVLSEPWPEAAGVPDELQAGPGEPGAENRDRAARRESPVASWPGAGREEAAEAGVSWLESPGLLERGDPEQYLWNLETDTGNYFANGILTHNCQALCNFGSLQSRQARRLTLHVANVIAGSGTPITKNIASFWPVLNAMYPASYPVRDRFKTHYCLAKRKEYGGGSDADVTGINPVMEPEFRIAMKGVFRRVAKADVLLDLPPKTYQTRWLDIPAEWRKAYNQMEEDMLAELPDVLTPLEVQSTLAKMTRLAQLASSACDVETWTEVEGNPKSKNFGTEVVRTKVTLREPCWKGTALLGLLAELHQGEGELDDLGAQHGHTVGSRPCIAFAPSRQLVTLAGKMAERKGYKVGYITGSVAPADRNTARHAFQRNELDLICVTLGAGGAGLTLTAADTEAFLQRSFAYVPNAQAEDRAHRRGQTKNVQVIDFVARDTVESDVRAVLREKAGNLAELVEDRRIVEGFLGGGRDRH